ncbi:MAG: branched-chain amino acid ABC transporter permease [Gemmatimonadales bacterium]|nr:branched-chain amino acid ABC transporter permease [Gemmatimonadales bacterium]
MEWLVTIPQFLAGGLAIGAVYGLIGAGFSLIYNTSRVINFAQGQFVVYGGLATVSMIASGMTPFLALPLAVLGCVALGGILQMLLATARRGSDELTFIMVTIGVAIAWQGLAHQIWGVDYLTFSLYPEGAVRLLGASVSYGTLATLVVTLFVCLGLWFFLYQTLVGKAMRACANDPRVAQTVGIRPRRMVLGAYLASASLGGLAGILVTPSLTMSAEFGVLLGIKGFTAAIVGGLANPFGAIVGGVLLGLFEGLCVGVISSDLQDAYAFIALLVILLLRPQGLFSRVLPAGSR